MTKQKLIIVESPTKAQTIKKFLPDFDIFASIGHIRDLPTSSKDIPKDKNIKWEIMGIDVNNDFKPFYTINNNKKDLVKKMVSIVKKADEIYLATDEDREGESISWHISEILNTRKKLQRMVFHEITKEAVVSALKNTRQIDMNLVHAQEARRILDRIVGFGVSPLLWKKVARNLSAGRVQSVVIKFIVDRELQIINFKKNIYWDLLAEFNVDDTKFSGQLIKYNDKPLARGINFDPNTGNLIKPEDFSCFNQPEILKLKNSLKDKPFEIISIDKKEVKRKTPAPFITSTLQQEAIQALRVSSKQIMNLAQSLYNKGFITYMRTDSTNLASSAQKEIKEVITKRFGKDYVSKGLPTSKASKNAQEAHEAIRPATNKFSDDLGKGLSELEAKLYQLIWKRTMASMMKDVILEQNTVTLKIGKAIFRATGRKIIFDGFWILYNAQKGNTDSNVLLPDLKVGQKIKPEQINEIEHKTEPKPRFNESSLVKLMESEGIGRPSTYSSVIETIINRGYVAKKKDAIYPTIVAFAVSNMLSKHISNLVESKFTSNMEDALDDIAAGKLNHIQYLKDFYLGEKGLKQTIDKIDKEVSNIDFRAVKLPHISEEIRIGKYGPYIQKSQKGKKVALKIPSDRPVSEINSEVLMDNMQSMSAGSDYIGIDPKTQKTIYYLQGPYGPYLQLGEKLDGKEKPKRVSLSTSTNISQLDQETILKLLELPIVLGEHPVLKKTIEINSGRFGPYVVLNTDKKVYISMSDINSMLNLTLEQAIDMFDKKGTAPEQKPLKIIGNEPKTNKQIAIFSGRYGHYIKCGKQNYSIPKDIKPDNIRLSLALDIIARKKAKNSQKRTTGLKK